MVRPCKSEIRKGILIKFLNEEKAIIREQAMVGGITVSEYIRRRALGKQVRSRLDAQVLGHLIRLGALQKHLLMQIKAHPHEDELRRELNTTLADLKAAVSVLLKKQEENAR
jgi:hypothetical protein